MDQGMMRLSGKQNPQATPTTGGMARVRQDKSNSGLEYPITYKKLTINTQSGTRISASRSYDAIVYKNRHYQFNFSGLDNVMAILDLSHLDNQTTGMPTPFKTVSQPSTNILSAIRVDEKIWCFTNVSGSIGIFYFDLVTEKFVTPTIGGTGYTQTNGGACLAPNKKIYLGTTNVSTVPQYFDTTNATVYNTRNMNSWSCDASYPILTDNGVFFINVTPAQAGQLVYVDPNTDKSYSVSTGLGFRAQFCHGSIFDKTTGILYIYGNDSKVTAFDTRSLTAVGQITGSWSYVVGAPFWGKDGNIYAVDSNNQLWGFSPKSWELRNLQTLPYINSSSGGDWASRAVRDSKGELYLLGESNGIAGDPYHVVKIDNI